MFGLNIKSMYTYNDNQKEVPMSENFVNCFPPSSRGYEGLNSPLETLTEIKKQHEEKDPINHPNHYTQGKIEVIEFIEDQKLNYHLANVIKYICRAPHKGTCLKDLKKAQWYLDRWVLIAEDIENSNEAEKSGG